MGTLEWSFVVNLLVRLLLAGSGMLAAIVLARESTSFGIVQVMILFVLIAGSIGILALLGRDRLSSLGKEAQHGPGDQRSSLG